MEKTLAERIGGRRVELGLSIADVAALMGLSHPAVQKWESGDAKSLRSDNLFLLADVLVCSPRWLATGYGSKEPEPGYTPRLVEHLQDQLGGDMEVVSMALARRSRADSQKAKQYWERIAEKVAKVTAALFMALGFLHPSDAPASVLHKNYGPLESVIRIASILAGLVRKLQGLSCSVLRMFHFATTP